MNSRYVGEKRPEYISAPIVASFKLKIDIDRQMGRREERKGCCFKFRL